MKYISIFQNSDALILCGSVHKGTCYGAALIQDESEIAPKPIHIICGTIAYFIGGKTADAITRSRKMHWRTPHTQKHKHIQSTYIVHGETTKTFT